VNAIPESVRREVLFRDGFGCVAPVVDQFGCGQCHDRYGRSGFKVPTAHLELDHVGEMRTGKAAKTIPSKLVTLCPGHHRGIGEKGGRCWATSHRFDLRAYLAVKYPAVYGSGQLNTTELHWAAFHEAQVGDASL
jgi:hypothetical protein